MERPIGSPRAGYWQALIDQQHLSGLSVKQFCLEQNVSVASFYQWRRRLTTQALIPAPVSTPAMFPVRLVPTPRQSSSPVAVQILTPNGYSLRIDANTCPEQLRTILAAVQASDSGAPSC
jgi:putative transposase